MKKAAHKWAVSGLDFKQRVFEYRNNALDFAAEAFAANDDQAILIEERGGFHSMVLVNDPDGATRIIGDYTDEAKRYLKVRLAHEMGLRNVKDRAA